MAQIVSWHSINARNGTDSTSRHSTNSINGTDGTSWHSINSLNGTDGTSWHRWYLMAQYKYHIMAEIVSWHSINARNRTYGISWHNINSLNCTNDTSWHSSALNCDFRRTGKDGTKQINLSNFRRQFCIDIGSAMQEVRLKSQSCCNIFCLANLMLNLDCVLSLAMCTVLEGTPCLSVCLSVGTTS